MIMQNIKKISCNIKKWWKNITNNETYGLLMRWATAITAIMLVVTTIVVIVKGVMSVCSKGK